MRKPVQWITIAVSVLIALLLIGCAKKTTPSDRFEIVRTYIDAWLSDSGDDKTPLSLSFVKDNIVDDWVNQRGKYQIVSVRNPEDFNNAGHIPHAINLYWINITNEDSLARLDRDKTLILYCYYGHASMLSNTILSLLGYKCRSLNFGMMGWNLDALVKKPWDREADYAVETKINEPVRFYRLPTIQDSLTNARSIIMEMTKRYFSGEGSPVITSEEVKAIVDDWRQKKAECQIIDVRPAGNYETGHIPHSINIPLEGIAKIKNLRKIDPQKLAIVYSENGQTGQITSTVLNLLGYRAMAMKFGMMDWNNSFVDTSLQWLSSAGYPIERSPQKQ